MTRLDGLGGTHPRNAEGFHHRLGAADDGRLVAAAVGAMPVGFAEGLGAEHHTTEVVVLVHDLDVRVIDATTASSSAP